jgi:hypothetical protein
MPLKTSRMIILLPLLLFTITLCSRPARAQNLEHVAKVTVSLTCDGAYEISGQETRPCKVTVTYDPAPPDQALPDPDFPNTFTGTIVVRGAGVEIARFNSVSVQRGGSVERSVTLNCQPSTSGSRTLRNMTNGRDTQRGSRVCTTINNPPCPRGCGGRFTPPCPSRCGQSTVVCTDNPVSVVANYRNNTGVVNKYSSPKNFLCLPGSGPTRGTF